MRRTSAPGARPRVRAGKARTAAEELRLFGLNACLAVFRHRPHALRKLYLTERRVPDLCEILAWCARERIGYRIVAEDDLARLTRSEHHEGVCFEVLREAPLTLADWLARERAVQGPRFALWLDGVGNPHNFGAVLRIGAHFGISAVLLPPGSGLALSGAACRVAEGGAEVVPLVALCEPVAALTALSRAGYALAATVVREGVDLYSAPLAARLVLVFGAESTGIASALLERIPHRLRIPGTGAVESLNIASAVGVIAAEHWRQHHGG